MALPMFVESLDGLEDSVKSFYIEDDGKFRLDIDGYEDSSALKASIKKLNEENTKRRIELKQFQERYDGIDPDKVKGLLSKLENDEEAKLLADGKIDEVVNRRIEKQRADLEKQVKDSLTKAEQAELRAKNFEQRVLDNAIRFAASKAGLHPHAIEDALFRARTMFKLNENGDAVMYDGDEIKPGKDGKSPYTPSEWLDEMKEKAPHWYPAMNSGGGGGGNDGTSGSKVDLSKLPPRERLQKARELGIQ